MITTGANEAGCHACNRHAKAGRQHQEGPVRLHNCSHIFILVCCLLVRRRVLGSDKDDADLLDDEPILPAGHIQPEVRLIWLRCSDKLCSCCRVLTARPISKLWPSLRWLRLTRPPPVCLRASLHCAPHQPTCCRRDRRFSRRLPARPHLPLRCKRAHSSLAIATATVAAVVRAAAAVRARLRCRWEARQALLHLLVLVAQALHRAQLHQSLLRQLLESPSR